MGRTARNCSKRHGAQFVLEFDEQGYLPEALCNYLLRLGWGHGDVECWAARKRSGCSTSRRRPRPGRMDYAKLNYLNGVYIRKADDERLAREVMQRLARHPGPTLDDASSAGRASAG